MKKTVLNENTLRTIVNKVVRKKILLEETEKVDQKNEEEKSKPKVEVEVEVKKNKGAGAVPDVGIIKDALIAGGTDKLAQQETNNMQRGGESLVAGGTAAAIAYSVVSYLAMGTGVVLGPTVGLPLALGAGLYYAFNSDAIVGSDAVKEALDTSLYDRISQAFKQIYDKFNDSKSPKVKENAQFFNPNVCLKQGILTPEAQSSIAQEIYDATQGGSLGLGIGTNEDEVKAALKKCKTFLGVSQVSKRHANKFAGGIIDDGNLYKVLIGEFNTSDFDTYVSSVIETLPFIYIGDKPYSRSEFGSWIEETKAIVDDLPNRYPEPNPEQGEGEGDVADDVDNYVKAIQKLMNEYCANKDLEYTPIKPDGVWGPKTNKLWLNPYLSHVLENHPDISKSNVTISGRGRWSDISAQLIGTFPGYTPGEKGCYRFCKDAISGKSSLGQKKGGNDNPIKYFGGGSRGGRKDNSKQKVIDNTEVIGGADNNQSVGNKRARSDGRLDYRNIFVNVEYPGENMITLDEAGLGNVEEFARKFISAFNSDRLNAKDEETIKMQIYPKKDFFDNKKITGVGVGKVEGSRWFTGFGIKNFKGIFRRHFNTQERLKTISDKGVVNKRDKKLIVSVTMPQGVYTAATNKLNEEKINKIKKLIKEIKNIKRTVY